MLLPSEVDVYQRFRYKGKDINCIISLLRNLKICALIVIAAFFSSNEMNTLARIEKEAYKQLSNNNNTISKEHDRHITQRQCRGVPWEKKNEEENNYLQEQE